MEIGAKLKEISQLFRVNGRFVGYEHIRIGNVNQTYTVTIRDKEGKRIRYLVQRINTYAFHNPEVVMHNIDLVTSYLHQRNPHLIGINFLQAEDGKSYVEDEDGVWRMSNFIPSVTHCSCEDPAIAVETGRAFGAFQALLLDFDASQLYETIPDFHNTPKRSATLLADAQRDPLGRVAQVQEELAFVASVQEEAGILARWLAAGELPLRVTHNDTKVNNVLFDEDRPYALTVVDLDTVMPGLVASDFGDAIRFGANREAEDSENWQNAGCDMEIFRNFARGFLGQTGGVLTPRELESLSIAPFVLSFECGIRFLDDYITGDPYFKIEFPQHNLVRTRCQFAMAKDCLSRREEMAAIIKECLPDQTC